MWIGARDKNKLKIIYVIYELGYGGQERQMSYAIKELTKAGHFINLIVWQPNSRSKSNAYKIDEENISLQYLKDGLFSKIKSLAKIASESSASSTIIQSWSVNVNFFVYCVCKFHNIRFFGAFRSNFNWFWAKASLIGKLKIIFHCVVPSTLVCNSRISKLQLVHFRKKYHRKGTVIYLPNRLALPELDGNEISTKINSLSVGSLQLYKRWDFLIEVINQLRLSGIDVVHKHIGLNGDQKENLETMIELFQLNDHFVFLGEMNDLSKEYRNADIFIHTSEVEGTPNAVMEAASYGIPIYSSDCGDVSTIFDNASGHVFKDYNVKGWCNVIRDDIEQGNLKSKGTISRQIALEIFDKKYLLEDLLKLYKIPKND